MSVELYWTSKSVAIEWLLTNLAGAPTNATVVATITLPNGTTASATVLNPAVGTFQAVYDPSSAGLHAYRIVATGAVDSAEEGTFYVKPSKTGSPPPTFDPTTSIGQVRLLVADVDEDNLLFTDAQVTAFLTLEGDSVKLAAAQALDTIASNEVMVSKVIRTQDLSTDGAKVSAELRARAAALREQVAEGLGDDASGFDIVDFDPLTGLSRGELAERGITWSWP